MPIQEAQPISKDTQKIVLKAMCESPVLGVEELALNLKSTGKNISQDEVLQVLHSISPNKNWHRATKEDVRKELLDYLWTLEAQVLFLLPTKQKETTVAEFNQMRLQNKQVKVQRDLIKHIQSLLYLEGKDLAKFRRFEKDLSLQTDLDPNVYATWLVRIILANINLAHLNSVQELPLILSNQSKEQFPTIAEKVGKTLHRICEKFVEKYFPKNISTEELKALIETYQSIYSTYKKGHGEETLTRGEFHDQHKLVQSIKDGLQEVQKIVSESHEGGFLSKLVSGKLKNREGIIKKIDDVLNLINQISDLSSQTNKLINEKVLLVQKLQTDYESVVLIKSQLENDLYNLNDKVNQSEEKSIHLEKELEEKTKSLERAHEKITMLQQKADEIPEQDAKLAQLRDELNTAKTIAVSLYQRVNKLKSDLLASRPVEKQKISRIPLEQKNGNSTVHKVQQDPETGETMLTTEVKL